jgi:hypothetical protein
MALVAPAFSIRVTQSGTSGADQTTHPVGTDQANYIPHGWCAVDAADLSTETQCDPGVDCPAGTVDVTCWNEASASYTARVVTSG